MSATRSLDRGRVEASAVEDAFAQDETQFVRVQQHAGVDYFSDGLIRWQDIFRPFAASAGPLVRWFDTNTFFRAPELSSSAGAGTVSGIVPTSSVPQPRVATFPSPYMFSRAVRAPGKDRNQLMTQIAERMLRPAIDAAVAAGARVVHLEEPWLAYFGIEKGDWAPFSEALRGIKPKGAASIVLHCYFGDAARFLDQLKALPVDGLGIDLVETDLADLGRGWEKDLVIGCLNGRSSVVESLESTVELARRVMDSARPKNLFLTSTSELGFLPTVVAEKKVERLGQATRRLKELVSV